MTPGGGSTAHKAVTAGVTALVTLLFLVYGPADTEDTQLFVGLLGTLITSLTTYLVPNRPKVEPRRGTAPPPVLPPEGP